MGFWNKLAKPFTLPAKVLARKELWSAMARVARATKAAMPYVAMASVVLPVGPAAVAAWVIRYGVPVSRALEDGQLSEQETKDAVRFAIAQILKKQQPGLSTQEANLAIEKALLKYNVVERKR